MNSLVFSNDIIFIASDITAGLCLMVLIISASLQTSKRMGLPYLLAAAYFVMAGIFVRIFAWTAPNLPPAASAVVWIISFALLLIAVTAAVAYAICTNGDGRKRDAISMTAITSVITAAGAVLFVITDNNNCFTSAILVHFICCILYLHRNCSAEAAREFDRASSFAILSFISALFYDQVRLTGIGLTVMLMILAEQYHYHIGQELAGEQAALERNRRQLLAGQVSSHYIYNSLQSIIGLCDTDPAKAKDALDAFSAYLRGNLESLTEEDFIPFRLELEHAQAYLELEKTAGNSSFDVEYDLGVTGFMMPPLVLQPLVENAVKHGAAGGEGATLITVSTRETESCIRIEVTDRTEGSGADTQKGTQNSQRNKNKSVGLENIRKRLELQCGGSLDISRTPGSTKVTVLMPKSNK